MFFATTRPVRARRAAYAPAMPFARPPASTHALAASAAAAASRADVDEADDRPGPCRWTCPAWPGSS